MANLDLFSKHGKFTAPGAEALAALTDGERAAIAAIGNAAGILETATVAVAENESALKSVQAEIAVAERSIPKITFNDLIKQQCRDTARRRSGL